MNDKYSFEKLNEVFVIDENSPSGLAYKVDIYRGRDNSSIVHKAGDFCLHRYTKNGIPTGWLVRLGGINRQVSRIIWVLTYGSIGDGAIISYLDGDNTNNRIDNLVTKGLGSIFQASKAGFKCCSLCKVEKALDEFHKSSKSKDGLFIYCKDCNSARSSKWGKSNPVRKKAQQDKWIQNNPEKNRAFKRKWSLANRSSNTARVRKRRAKQLNATPPWLTKEDILYMQDLYEIAAAFKLYTGQEYHVDHILPLQGKTVCGLHCPANLRIITSSENLSKGNKLIDPEAWD